MKSVVVYESHWGNTEAIARAIVAGLGEGAVALTTEEATSEAIRNADLIVAGAPVMAFALSSDKVYADLARHHDDSPTPPDLSHRPMRDWLADLPEGTARSAAFETAFRWSPSRALGQIERGLAAAGHVRLAKGRRFVVNGTSGPLRDGELNAARFWGVDLARALDAVLAGPRTPAAAA